MWLILLVSVIGAEPEVQPPAFFAGNEELHAYLVEAAENHPGLHARHAEWLAALEKIPQVTALDNPQFTYSYFVRSEKSQYRVGLMQMFPWFGTLRARGDAAVSEAEAALQGFYAERNTLFTDVKRAYFEYAYLSENFRVTQGQVELLQYMEETVRTKYALGLATEDELLRVQMEQSAIQDRLKELAQFRPALAARLTTALGRDNAEPPEWPEPCGLPPAPPEPAAVLARVRGANPEVRVMDHVIDARAAEIRLAKKMGYPEFTLGVEFEEMKNMPPMMDKTTATLEAAGAANSLLTGMAANPFEAAMNVNSLAQYDRFVTGKEPDDELMLSLTLSLPVWRKKVKAGIAEARQMKSAAEHEKQRVILSLEEATRMAYFEMQDAQRRYSLYADDLLPKARLAYESLQVSYATSAGADFLDLLQSVQTLLNFELEQVRAVRDVQQASARLESLMGGPWAESGDSAALAGDDLLSEEAKFPITVKRNGDGDTEG